MSLQLQREYDFVSYVFGKTSGAEICLGSRRVNLRVANRCSLTGQCQIVSPAEAYSIDQDDEPLFPILFLFVNFHDVNADQDAKARHRTSTPSNRSAFQQRQP